MRIVRRHHRDAQLTLQTKQVGTDVLLLFQALILNFKKEIPLAEDVLILLRYASGLGVVVGFERLAQFTAQAA